MQQTSEHRSQRVVDTIRAVAMPTSDVISGHASAAWRRRDALIPAGR